MQIDANALAALRDNSLSLEINVLIDCLGSSEPRVTALY
jgi:hypothetical protein